MTHHQIRRNFLKPGMSTVQDTLPELRNNWSSRLVILHSYSLRDVLYKHTKNGFLKNPQETIFKNFPFSYLKIIQLTSFKIGCFTR